MIRRFGKLIANPPEEVVGSIVDNHIILNITNPYQHYWSPELNFRVEADETNENVSIVAGLIGPKPAVWTLFMFIYFLIGIVGFFISAFGVSKWILGEYSNLLLGLPVALLIMLSAYGVGKYGEQLAKDQIEILKQFVRDGIYY